MANWRNNDVQIPPEDKGSKTALTALSAYEQSLFNKILEKKAVEKAQTEYANDRTLRDEFDVVH